MTASRTHARLTGARNAVTAAGAAVVNVTAATVKAATVKAAAVAMITVAAVTAGLLTPAAQAAPLARPAAASHPSGRQWPAFAYDPAFHEFVLFGGNRSTAVYGDTWIRRGGVWTREHPATHPSPHTGAALVWDAATSQLLMFGGTTKPGYGGGYSSQTWIWTGSTWTLLHPAASPPARHNADMVYDAATGEVILFGGYDGHYFNDTWAWTGSTWTQLNPATRPRARDSDSMAYDADTGTVLMYGGFDDRGRLGGTWSWNGTNWTQLHPADSPGEVSFAWQAAWDPASHQLLLFGGDPGGGQPSLNWTWAWTGSNWTQLTPATSPPGRFYGALAWNPDSQQLALFGGAGIGSAQGYSATVWNWTGTTWSS